MKKNSSVNIVLIILFILSITTAYPQNKESNLFKVIGNDFSTTFRDGISLYTSPFRFSGNDWLKTGGVIIAGSALMNFDKDIRKEFSKGHTNTKDKLADIGNGYGNAFVPVILGGGIYSYGLFFKNDYVRETGRMVIEAVVFAGIFTDVSKVIIGRSRPYTERGPYFYKLFSFNSDFLSLPSGHSTVAFAASTVLANRINNIYASIGLYSLSALTVVSRMYSDDHWSSDVLLGSAIGYFVGDFISGGIKLNKSNKKTTLNLYPSPGGVSMRLCF